MNDYYDVRLKEYRLEKLSSSKTFSFVKGNLADKELINSIFEKYTPQVVVNLGAQAGVRYSITNPDAYIEGNLIGFYNILEGCRHYPVEHLVYASSSSVYGSNKKVPYSTEDKVDNPVSLYAAKSIWQLLTRSIYSREVEKAIKKEIKDVKPDLVYIIHFVNKLSPSVITGASKMGIPVVLRLSDYFLLCPRFDFMYEKKVCEECLSKGYRSCEKRVYILFRYRYRSCS